MESSILVPVIEEISTVPPVAASDTPFLLRVRVSEVLTYLCAPRSGAISAGMEVWPCQ